MQILLSTTGTEEKIPEKVLSAHDLLEIQSLIREIPVPQSVAEFAVRLVSSTRPGDDKATAMIKKYTRWGAGPRACQYLALAGKVHAALEGRFNVAKEDVVKAAHAVLRHRIILNYRAEADGLSPDDIISELLNEVKK